MNEYRVNLEVFEGPLDLLLYLVRRAEVDIYHIPIVQITDQYLKVLEIMKLLDLDVAGEFLWMASNLIYLKSRMLLPMQEAAQEEEEEGLDPRSELIRQLLEYKKFKEAAETLEKLESERKLYFPREAAEGAEFQEESWELERVNLFDLLGAFSEVLQKFQVRDDLKKIFDEEVSVEQKIVQVERMLSMAKTFRFQDLFLEAASRMEVVVTFLAVLELIRLRRVRIFQEDNFGQILIQGGAP